MIEELFPEECLERDLFNELDGYWDEVKRLLMYYSLSNYS